MVDTETKRIIDEMYQAHENEKLHVEQILKWLDENGYEFAFNTNK